MSGEVEGGEVADGDVVLVLRQTDLGAEVRHMDRAGIVVECAKIDGVLPGEPRVRRGLQSRRGSGGIARCAGTFL